MAARLRAARQEAGSFDASSASRAAAEVLVRIRFSFVLIQQSVLPLDDPDQARDVARRLIAPILGRPPA